MPETRPLAGDIVEYCTVPCTSPDEGLDLALYSNYAREDRMKPIWRPALVLRVWEDDNPASLLNLRVYADAGDALSDVWRTSVPRREDATGMMGWRPRIHRLDGQHPRDESTRTRGLPGA